MANLTSSIYPIYSTVTYPCGLTLNHNLVARIDSTVILGGLYKGKTLRRLRKHLPFSAIAIFEPSKYQQKYGALLQQNDSLITLVPAALGKVPDSGYAVFGDFSAKVAANNGKYGYGSLSSTDDRAKHSEYLVPVCNLSEWIVQNNLSNLSHIHLDIEGSELDVIEQFSTPLNLITHQLSLELQPLPGGTLLDAFNRLNSIMKGHHFISLIIYNNTVLPFDRYKDFLSKVPSCNMYCFYANQFVSVTSRSLITDFLKVTL